MLLIFLTGCSKQETPTVATPTDATVMADNYELGTLTTPEDDRVVFAPNIIMPVTKDGILYGSLQINYVERLGIWDINNYMANENGVRYSYAINCTIDLETYVAEHEMINVIMTPEILNYKDECIGSVGYVGWSGFADSFELYDNSSSGTCEVVLQPNTLEEIKYLRFTLTDASSQVVFDDLYVDPICLTEATDGAQIKTIDDSVTIISSNGASYSLKFHDVYLELHKVRNDSYYKNGDYRFFDFMYDVNYLNGPTNETEVLYYDYFNDYALIDMPIMEIYSDQDSTKLLEEVKTAERLLWSNKTKTGNYVVPFPRALYIGEQTTVSSNRMVPTTTLIQPTYLRVVLKFPAEVTMLTSEEIRDFSGRYVVYQLPLGVRTLEEEPR